MVAGRAPWHGMSVAEDSDSGSQKGKRLHDVRAPRASRSTKDSPRYQQMERPERTREPRGRPPPNRSRSAPPPSTLRSVRDEEANVRSADAARARSVVNVAAHEKSVATERRSAPPLPPAPESTATPTTARSVSRPPVPPPVPAPPAERKAADELRILSAPPVVAVPRRKEKPRTAKEALRARTEQRGGRSGGKNLPKDKPAKKPRASDATRETQEDRDDVAPSDEEAVSTQPVSIWDRVKRMFGRG
jgi:hypothetical protein